MKDTPRALVYRNRSGNIATETGQPFMPIVDVVRVLNPGGAGHLLSAVTFHQPSKVQYRLDQLINSLKCYRSMPKSGRISRDDQKKQHYCDRHASSETILDLRNSS